MSPSRLRLTANGTLYDKEVTGSNPVLTTKVKIMKIVLIIIGVILVVKLAFFMADFHGKDIK